MTLTLKTSSLGLAAVVVILASGCPGGERPASGSAEGGTIVMGSISDVDSWNEYLSGHAFTNTVLRRIFLRLAQEQGDGDRHPPSFAPLLAESWSFSDDGLSLTFRLRDAQWSDGRPVTADDVRFTWEAQVSREVPWVGAGAKSRITDVEIVDERTVTYHFDGRYPFQLADAVDGGIVPRHVFGQVPFADWATHDWSSLSVGSGPFVLERYVPDQEFVLRRNPRYFDADLPLAERVVVRVVPDIANLLTQLRSGEIDYVERITPRDASRLSDDPDLTVIGFEYPSYDFVGWNGSRTPFDDPDVRRAMTLAIDRQGLVEDLLYGHGRVSAGPVLSHWWAADPTLAPWPYAPDEARRILVQHGYATLNADGSRSSGPTLELELMTNSGNRLRENVLVKIQEQLGRIGVLAQPRVLDLGALRSRAVAGDYDGYVGAWTYGIQDLASIFGSAAHPPDGFNVVFYSSAEVDRLFDRLAEATDWEAMKTDLSAIQRRIHADQPYTFLYETPRLALIGPRLDGVEIDVPADPLARLERYRIR
jgi:peptide/nickel transport system substrate-binding protein